MFSWINKKKVKIVEIFYSKQHINPKSLFARGRQKLTLFAFKPKSYNVFLIISIQASKTEYSTFTSFTCTCNHHLAF